MYQINCLENKGRMEGEILRLNNNIPCNRDGRYMEKKQNYTYLGSLQIRWTNIGQGIELKK
jgi:hypothetical protein